MSQESTAVALTDEQNTEVAQIQQSGRLAVQRERAIRDVYVQLKGLEWGEKMSNHTRAVFAGFCADVGANPAYHVDLLGSKPYLNANYWSDKINAEPHFITFEQFNISADKEKREFWGVPDWATHVFETEITRFINVAPLDRIRAGEVADPSFFIRKVRECNWAGGRGVVERKRKDGGTYKSEADPIGDAEPAKTARTRSLRRCAARAFEAIRIQNKERIERAEELLMAEWETEIRQQQALLARDNPRGLPSGELVPVVRRAGGAGNDWESARVDPAMAKQAPIRETLPRGVSQAQYEDDQRRAGAEEQDAGPVPDGFPEDGFPANVLEDPQ